MQTFTLLVGLFPLSWSRYRVSWPIVRTRPVPNQIPKFSKRSARMERVTAFLSAWTKSWQHLSPIRQISRGPSPPILQRDERFPFVLASGAFLRLGNSHSFYENAIILGPSRDFRPEAVGAALGFERREKLASEQLLVRWIDRFAAPETLH